MKNFIGVYYEWGRDAKGTYEKVNMEKYLKKIV